MGENTTEDISDVKAEKVKLPKQEKKQKRPPKVKRKSENERISESESLPVQEADNLSETTEIKTNEAVPEVESIIDNADDALLIKEPETPVDDLDLAIPDVQVEILETKSAPTKQKKPPKKKKKKKKKKS